MVGKRASGWDQSLWEESIKGGRSIQVTPHPGRPPCLLGGPPRQKERVEGSGLHSLGVCIVGLLTIKVAREQHLWLPPHYTSLSKTCTGWGCWYELHIGPESLRDGPGRKFGPAVQDCREGPQKGCDRHRAKRTPHWTSRAAFGYHIITLPVKGITDSTLWGKTWLASIPKTALAPKILDLHSLCRNTPI